MTVIEHYERIWYVGGRWNTYTPRQQEADSVHKSEGAGVVEYVRADIHRGAVEAVERAERLAELWKRSPDVQVKRCGADLAAVLKALEPLPHPGGQ